MKKNLLFPLTFLFILLFGLASCSDNNNLKTQADVTIDFPVQELFNIASAREADNPVEISLIITVTLYVNGTQFGDPQQKEFTSQMRDSGGSFEFKDIAIGSRVKATAQVDSVSVVNGQKSVYPMLKGESQELKLSNSTLELPIELEYIDPEVIDPDYNLCLQFLTQKLDSDGNPLADEYEVYSSNYVHTDDSVEQIIAYKGFNTTNEEFVIHIAKNTIELTSQGYTAKRNSKDEEVLDVSLGADGFIYMKYYWDKTRNSPVVKTITGSASDKNYTLKIYSTGVYEINDNSDLTVLGFWDCTKYDGKIPEYPVDVNFTQTVYTQNNITRLTPGRMYEGEFISNPNDPHFHEDISSVTWDEDTASFEIKIFTHNNIQPVTFYLPSLFWFDIRSFENSEGSFTNNTQQTIEEHENNITLEVYLKKADMDGNPVDDTPPEYMASYSTYTAFDYEYMYAKYLEEEECNEQGIPYDDPDEELRTGDDWTNLGFVPGKYYPGMYFNLATAIDFISLEADDQFCFEIDGKTIVDDKYEVTKNGEYTTIKNIIYYYQEDPKIPVVLSGSAGEKNYTFSLYDSGLYIIKDSTDKNIAMGMCQVYETDSSSSPESKSLMFQEMLYYENDKAKLAPFIYKDSKIYVMGSSMEEIDFVPLNGSTFAVTYRTQNAADNFPITFTMPAGFDISEFIKDSGGDGGNDGDGLHANSTVVFKGQPDILINQINPSEALCLSSGSASFQAASIYPNNFVPNQLGITSMTATLYYSGEEVPSSQYTAYFDSLNTLTIQPVALAKGGSYVVQVKASDDNCSISSNFVLTVQNKVITTLDVSDDDFLESLMNLLADAGGAVDLTLTGSRDTVVQDYNYTSDTSLYQLLGYCFIQYHNNPVILDMSGVSGTSVEVFETNGYQGVCTSVKLAPGLRAIRYKAGNMIDVSQSDSSVSAGNWYYIEAESGNTWTDAVNELLGGKPLTEDVFNSLVDQFNQYTTFEIQESNWDEVLQFLSTGAGTKSNMDYIFIKGE